VTDQYETVNSASIVDFFEQIKARYASSSCINIILDGAGYHRSDQIVNKAEELNIKLHYLPPYSPNLNPIEQLRGVAIFAKVWNARAGSPQKA
jgi:transposase